MILRGLLLPVHCIGWVLHYPCHCTLLLHPKDQQDVIYFIYLPLLSIIYGVPERQTMRGAGVVCFLLLFSLSFSSCSKLCPSCIMFLLLSNGHHVRDDILISLDLVREPDYYLDAY